MKRNVKRLAALVLSLLLIIEEATAAMAAEGSSSVEETANTTKKSFAESAVYEDTEGSDDVAREDYENTAAIVAAELAEKAVETSGSESEEVSSGSLAADTSGKCGNNLQWSYDQDTYTLTFTGSGDMWDYNYSGSPPPWYSYRQSVQHVVIPDSVTRIGGYAFYQFSICAETFPVPSSLEGIGEGAFYDSGFQQAELSFPASTTEIGKYSFRGCTGIRKVVIPENVNSIEEGAFMGCTNLVTLDYTSGVESIGSSAFSGCKALQSLAVPAGVKSIGKYAFNCCTSLKGDLELPQSLTSLGEAAFNGCEGYEGSLIIRSGLTAIPWEAFQGCKFRNITLPSTLRTVGYYAFSGNQASKIVVPELVTSIAERGFSGSNLRSVYFQGNAPGTFDNTSCGSTSDVKLYYLADKSGWSDTYKGYACIAVSEEDFPDDGSDEPVAVAVTGVTLDKAEAELAVGGNVTLTATVAPGDASNKSVVWSSSNKSVAVVTQNGIVTGVAAGTSDITVTTVDGGKTATCKITVTDETVAVTGITLDKTEAELTVGSSLVLTPTIVPANATNTNVVWASDTNAVARVSANGKVTAIAEGTTIITVTTEDGEKTACCTVTVKEEDPEAVAVTEVSLDKTAKELKVGGTLILTATVKPDDATNKELIWESSKPSVATVDQTGKVTAVTVGKAVITVSSAANENAFATCTVTVTESGGDEPEPGPTPAPTPTTDKYNVVFYVGDDKVAEEEVVSGDTVTNVPEAAGKGTFAGWYTAEDALWDPTMPVLRNLELEARFVNEGGEAEQKHSGLDPSLVVHNEQDYYMVKGQSVVLDSSKTWTSGDRKVVNVNGKYKITAKDTGSTTVTSSDGSETYNIFVTQPAIYKDGKTAKKADVVLGNTIELSVGNLGSYDRSTGSWEYEDFYDVTWQSANTEVAKVDNGLIYGLQKGSTNITAYLGGKAYTCKVTVKDLYSVSEYAGALNLSPLQTVTIKYNDGFKVKNGVWTSTLGMKAAYKKNNKIDYYQDGVVRITPAGKLTAVGRGTTELTVTNNGASKSFTVTVADRVMNAVYLNAGKTKSIKYYNVKSSGQRAASWSIDPVGTYATVTQKGSVKGTAGTSGKSVVTCTYDPYNTGGFTYKTTVYTENPSIVTNDGMTKKDKTAGITKTAEVKLRVGETFPIQMTGTVKPVLYTSNKNAVAFVDEAGVISARGKGKANLTARINGVKYTVQVTVTD